MTTLGYKIEKSRLGRLELLLYDLEQPIKRPARSDEPPFVLIERHVIESTPQGVSIAHRRKAIPIPEKE